MIFLLPQDRLRIWHNVPSFILILQKAVDLNHDES